MLRFDPSLVRVRDRMGWTAFYMCSRRERYDAMRFLLTYGADINLLERGYESPVHFAANSNSAELMRFLISHGADVDLKDKNDRTPLHLAAQYGYDEVVEVLVRHGACVNEQDDYGMAPLHLAAGNHYLHSTELLLVAGADINRKNNFGRTPLHEALSISSEKLDRLAVSVHDEYPPDYAPQNEKPCLDSEIIAALLAAHADLAIKDDLGMTPLDVANLMKFPLAKTALSQ